MTEEPTTRGKQKRLQLTPLDRQLIRDYLVVKKEQLQLGAARTHRAARVDPTGSMKASNLYYRHALATTDWLIAQLFPRGKQPEPPPVS